MTVSPNRPQDGDRPSAAAQTDTDDRLVSPALPPTLFALPNLNAPIEPKAQDDPIAAVESGVSSLATPRAEEGVPETAVAPESPAFESRTPESPASEGPARSSPVPESRSPHDEPAGRGWMEKIGAHTLVLLMLVIVVAAALVTGRKRGDAPQADSVAVDLIEDSINTEIGKIDSGTVTTDLPIPPHVSADLDPPATSGSELASASKSQPDHSPAPFDAHLSVDASPASTRNYTEATKPPVQSGALTSEPALAGAQPSDSPTTWDGQRDSAPDAESAPRFSRTPAGISDWMQYLPSMTAATHEETTASDFEPTVDADATPSP